jgi:CheY-like chemotaxis protein
LFAGRKLLVADDSPYYRTVLGLTFTDEGMAVDTTGSGQDALAKLEQSPPDVVLASVTLAGLNGYELCKRIKQSERFGHIPVMLLVGLHEQFDEAAARRAGADDVVTKPFKSIRQLVGRVGSLLGGKSADTEELGRGSSMLGLGVSEPVHTADTDHREIHDPNAKGDDGASLMAVSEPAEADVELQESTSGADINLQTADTQRLEMPDAAQAPMPGFQTEEDTNVKVFVEAASIPSHASAEVEVEAAGSTCVADVELQTANTRKLERIDDAPLGKTIEPAYAQEDAMKFIPGVNDDLALPSGVTATENPSSVGASEMNEETNAQSAALHSPPIFNDALLDLGNFNSPIPQVVSEDLVLDLDYDEVPGAAAVPEMVAETAVVTEAAAPVGTAPPEPVYEEHPVFELQESAVITEPEAKETMAVDVIADQGVAPGLGLSPEAIDAIARRAVEYMSEKVVREIAWEVVPELAELLIKKKLEEQK